MGRNGAEIERLEARRRELLNEEFADYGEKTELDDIGYDLENLYEIPAPRFSVRAIQIRSERADLLGEIRRLQEQDRYEDFLAAAEVFEKTWPGSHVIRKGEVVVTNYDECYGHMTKESKLFGPG